MSIRLAAMAAVAATFLSGCTTQIHAKDETIRPSSVPLGSFKYAQLQPLLVEKMEGDPGDQRAVQKMQEELKTCMGRVFATALKAAPGDGRQLLIEPSVVDLKKVNTAERIFVGSLAGSSAVLLKVKYSDAVTKEVVAEPVFYAKANAMGGAWSFGSTDNVMLTRVVDNACDYVRQYY